MFVAGYLKDCGVRDSFKGYAAKNIKEWFIDDAENLESMYGYDIDLLIKMALGQIADATKEVDYDVEDLYILQNTYY